MLKLGFGLSSAKADIILDKILHCTEYRKYLVIVCEILTVLVFSRFMILATPSVLI